MSDEEDNESMGGDDSSEYEESDSERSSDEEGDPKDALKKKGSSSHSKRREPEKKGEYFPFKGTPKVKEANVYAISHVKRDTRARLERYINEAMQLDHMYIEKLYGRVNPSINRDYEYFWESPWVEEHIHDSNKKRRMDEQNRNYAYRNFIRANADNKKASLKRTLQTMQEFDDMSRKDYVRLVLNVMCI